VTTPGGHEPPGTPFGADERPERIATPVCVGDIDRFGHVLMENSPVSQPDCPVSPARGGARALGRPGRVLSERQDAVACMQCA
jgi:hypothetical protein